MLFIIHRMNSINSIVHTKSKSTITFDINFFKSLLSHTGKIMCLDASKNMIGTAMSDDRKVVALSHVLVERDKLEEDIKKMASRLASEMGGWIFHSKVDFSKPTPHIKLTRKICPEWSIVELITKNGESHEKFVGAPLGSSMNPLSRNKLYKKFKS